MLSEQYEQLKRDYEAGSYKSRVTSYTLQVTSYKLQATSYKLQATSYLQQDHGGDGPRAARGGQHRELRTWFTADEPLISRTDWPFASSWIAARVADEQRMASVAARRSVET